MSKKLEKSSQPLITYSLQACSLLQYGLRLAVIMLACCESTQPSSGQPGYRLCPHASSTPARTVPCQQAHAAQARHRLDPLLQTWRLLHQAGEASPAAWQPQTISGTSLGVRSHSPCTAQQTEPQHNLGFWRSCVEVMAKHGPARTPLSAPTCPKRHPLPPAAVNAPRVLEQQRRSCYKPTTSTHFKCKSELKD